MLDFPDVSRKRHPDNHSTSTKALLSSDNQYLKSDAEDAERTLRWLALRRENPETAATAMKENDEKEWLVKSKNIAAAWYAAEILAPQNGITCLSKAATFSKFDKRWYGCVSAGKGSGKLARVHMGASRWTDRKVAICFAFRNAIRQLLPMQPNTAEKAAWSETKNQAARKEGIDSLYT